MGPSLERPAVLLITGGHGVICGIPMDFYLRATLAKGPDGLWPFWLADRCTARADRADQCPTSAIILNRKPKDIAL